MPTTGLGVAMLILAFLLLLSSGLSSSAIESGSGNYTICGSLVEAQGYACEEHTVTTQDGYILSLQRIPRGRSGNGATKPPVLLQHGVLMDGASWLVNQPNQSLAYVLADHGFDVWIANSRGTRFSRGHISRTPSDPLHWEWSWDEMASYDLPATIGYVHNQTQQNMHYVGHSLGALIAITPLSENSLFVVEKLRGVALLSPITYLQHVDPLIVNFSRAMLSHEEEWKNVHEFDPKSPRVGALVKDLCSNTFWGCDDLVSTFKTLTGKAKICKFDYGSEENSRRYGTPWPFEFDLYPLAFEVPLYVAWGGLDQASDGEDLAHLFHDLDNHGIGRLVQEKVREYGHADFVLASNANSLIYDYLITFFNQY